MNAQSLLCNFDEIEYLTVKNDIDILCASETWLLPNISNNLINIPMYNVFRCDKGRGGGACIHIKSDLKVTELDVGIAKTEGIDDV